MKSAVAFFSPSVRLNPGENHILLTAEDNTGNANEKRIVIHRKKPEVYKNKYRLSLKITNFDHPLNADPGYLFQHQFLEKILNSSRFLVFFQSLPDTVVQGLKGYSNE